MGHKLGPKSHVSMATLVRVLLAMTAEIWDRECGVFWAFFVVFAILGKGGNTTSPLSKGPSREGVAISCSI